MISRFRARRDRVRPGQALVEFALIMPLFISILLGVIVLGIVVFYNQQLTNAAREAARFASVHSASAQCPVVGTLDPGGTVGTTIDPVTGHTAAWGAPRTYVRCDPPSSWPQMTAFGRSKVFGLNAAGVEFAACWSGYRTATQYDAPPPGTYAVQGVINSSWAQCSIGGADPTSNPSAIGCAPGLATRDTASDISEGQGRIVANRVTVYACYQWSPPGAGFLLIPQTFTFRAVISEPIQRQQ
jgi:hypothetical protein